MKISSINLTGNPIEIDCTNRI